jgi:hypothetical protein
MTPVSPPFSAQISWAGRLLVTCMLIYGWLPSAHAFIVRVSETGTFNGQSNFSNRRLEEVNLDIHREFPFQADVGGVLVPRISVTTADASANGKTGALKARVHHGNAGGGGPGFGQLTVNASFEDTFSIFSTGGGISRPGVRAIGDPTDNLITIRLSGLLTGSAALGGGAGGVPGGTSAFNLGSTSATFTYGLDVGGNFLRGTSTLRESTSAVNIADTIQQVTNSTFTPNDRSIVLGTTTATPGSVTMHLDRTRYFALTDRRISVFAALEVFARAGGFAGSEVDANYGNSAYVNLEIEEGFFWLPGIAANRGLLSTPAFPTAVPLPPALPLFGAAVAGLGWLRRRRM